MEGIGGAAFLPAGSGDESTFTFIQVVGRIQLHVDAGNTNVVVLRKTCRLRVVQVAPGAPVLSWLSLNMGRQTHPWCTAIECFIYNAHICTCTFFKEDVLNKWCSNGSMLHTEAGFKGDVCALV